MTIMINEPQGSQAWLEARSGVITASRFSDARATLSRTTKNGSAGDPAGKAIEYAWQVALERIAGEPVSQAFETWQMRRGTELEPEARMTYEAETGLLASEEGLILSDDRAFGYSSDGLVGEDGLIEIKCPANCQKIGSTWADPEQSVAEYIDQIQGGMWITGRQWCDFVMYCPWLEPVGKELFRRRIERDDAYIGDLERDLVSFRRLVESYENLLRADAA